MKTLHRLMFILTAAALLGPRTAPALYTEKDIEPPIKDEATYRWPLVSAPLLDAVPTIDGTVDKREWSGAALLSPLLDFRTGMAVRDRTKVYIGYTADRLYIAFHCTRAPLDPPPKALQTEGRDGGIWKDDCVELFLRPDMTKRSAFNLVGNAASVRGDGITATATDKDWDPDWDYASRIVEDGWEGEMAIPFAALGTETPEEGTVWGFNFIRNRKTPTIDLESWSYMGDWNRQEDFGYLVFGGACPAVRLETIGEVTAKDTGFVIDVVNRTGSARRVVVEGEVMAGDTRERNYYHTFEGEADVFGSMSEAVANEDPAKVFNKVHGFYETRAEESREAAVPADQRASVVLQKEAPPGSYAVRYKVVGQDGKLLAGGVWPFVKTVPLHLTCVPYLLTSDKLVVKADLMRVDGVGEGAGIEATVKNQDGDQVASATERLSAGQEEVELVLPATGLTPGPYGITARVTDPNGKPLARNEIEWIRPPDPAWHANTLGVPREVPPPWTPVEVKGADASVWGRTIRMKDGGLPVSLVNQAEEMLAGPMSLTVNGETCAWTEQEDRAEHTPLKAVWTSRASAGDCEVSLDASLAFDGFMRFDLAVKPRAGRPIQSLVLEIPLRAEHATHSYPPFGETDAVPAETVTSSFEPVLWLGSDRRGLQLFFESDRGWRPAGSDEAVQLLPGEDTVRLRLVLIDAATPVDDAWTVSWGMTATPVKPLDQRMLRETFVTQGGFPQYEPGWFEKWKKTIEVVKGVGANAHICWSHPPNGIWNSYFGHPFQPDPERVEAMKKCVDYAHEKGIKILVYAIWGGMHPDEEDFRDFGLEMARHPLKYSLNNTLRYCPSGSFNDWYVYHLAKTVRETGIDGVYLDSSPFPYACKNLSHGCGYVGPDGKVHATRSIFGNRELHKRIYTLFHGGLKDDGILYVHSSPFQMNAEAFVDIHHTAEASKLPRDVWRSQYYGRPFGLPVTFTYWNQPHYPMNRINAWGAALLLDAELKATTGMFPPHGSWLPKNDYSDKAHIVSHVWDLKRTFPWDGSEWVPFWRAGELVQTGDEDVLVSLHVHPGRETLLYPVNWTEEPKTATLTVDWAAFGMAPDSVALTDEVTGEAVPVADDGSVTIEIGARRPRILRAVVR